MMPGSMARSRAANVERMRRAGEATRKRSKRLRTAAASAALPPMPDPRRELIANALSGDLYAQWRADALYGVGWRCS